VSTGIRFDQGVSPFRIQPVALQAESELVAAPGKIDEEVFREKHPGRLIGMASRYALGP
jgi:hypothetical protein